MTLGRPPDPTGTSGSAGQLGSTAAKERGASMQFIQLKERCLFELRLEENTEKVPSLT